METRKKYKIMLSEKYVRKSENGKEWFQFPVNISGQLVAIQTIIPLDPYTEPDLDAVREEAFKNGYDAACKDIDIKSKTNAALQKGREDAWEAARKIASDNAGHNYSIFGQHFTVEILNTHSASEAIEKIRQYEQEQEEQDGLRQNIQTIVDQCGYSLDEIATVLQKMKES